MPSIPSTLEYRESTAVAFLVKCIHRHLHGRVLFLKYAGCKAGLLLQSSAQGVHRESVGSSSYSYSGCRTHETGKACVDVSALGVVLYLRVRD